MRKSTLYIVAAFLFTILIGVLLFNTIKLSDFASDNNNMKETKVKITFIHWIYIPEEIFTKFNEEFPNITVDYQRYNMASYSEILQKKIFMGEKLDVFGVNELELFKYGNQNILLDLSNEKFLQKYKPEIRSEIQKLSNNKEYAVSYNAECFGIWYNKIIFKKYNLSVPENYSELLEICETLKQKDIQPIVIGAKDPEVASYLYLLRIINFMEDENWQTDLKTGKKSFVKGELLNLFIETEDMIKNGYISKKSVELSYHQAFSYFINAKAAMVIAPDRSLNMIEDESPNICDPGVFVIPYADNKTDIKTTVNYLSALIGINKDSQCVDEAKLFLEFLSRPEIAKIYYDDTLSYPTILETNANKLIYNELWEPIRSNNSRNLYDGYISKDANSILNNSAKAFIAELITAKDLAEVFQKYFAKKYY
jgi:raffinose/stachyose/melibiose transport system substrate-binding protein